MKNKNICKYLDENLINSYFIEKYCEKCKSNIFCKKRNLFSCNSYCIFIDGIRVLDFLIKESRRISQEKKFKKPSIDRISEFCKKRENGLNAQELFNLFEKNDWKNKNGKKIVNWAWAIIAIEKSKKPN